ASARRARIAEEAARILIEEGLTDYGCAKRKAALRLGEGEHGQHLPSNQEIEQALSVRQRLYAAGLTREQIQKMRQVACGVMRFLLPIQARLTGGALTEIGPTAAEIELHVFADPPELVAFRLLDAGIDYDLTERKLRFKGAEPSLPVYRFEEAGWAVHLTVFKPDDIRQSPLSPVNGRPLQRIGLRVLEGLLEAEMRAGHCQVPELALPPRWLICK
ncbi:hypothetical protein B2A_03759, partial [mine drainage metagenome]